MTPSPRSPALVIVSTSGTGGDIQPFIALARGLHDRGHRVLLLLPKFHEAAAASARLAFETVGTHEEFQALLDEPDLWHERKGWGVIWNGMVPHLDVLCDVIRRRPADERCVVLTHPLLVPMAALARAVRPELRIVAGILAPANLCSSHDLLSVGRLRIPRWLPLAWRQTLWRLIHRLWIDPSTLPALNAARQRHGLAPVPHFFEHMLGTPDASVGLFPGWYAETQPDWPRPFVTGTSLPAAPPATTAAAGLAPELARFLADGDPPIVFTPGTGHRHAAGFFRAALQATIRLRRRGLFITPHAAQLPSPLPPHILWQAHAPFALLLPQVAALVHHGGIGTTADALRAGVPQLVVPFAYDQFDNALRAQRLGVAEILLAGRVSSRRMRRRLAALLASASHLRACGEVAERMRGEPQMPWLLDRVEDALGIVKPPAAAPA